ncbi:tetratricopeptide repeat protein [bacterium]|nr:tetratricopeptide repeat protein [bacterium]
MAKSAERSNDFRTALSIYRRLAQRSEYREEAITGQVRVLLAVGNPDQALAMVNELLEDQNPFRAEARFLKAKCLKAFGKSEDALVEVSRAEKLRGDYPEALILRAELLFSLSRHIELEELLASRKQKGKSLDLILLAARNAEALGKTTFAISDYLRVLLSDPNNLAALESLGNIYLKTHQAKESLRIFERIVTSHPSNLAGWNGKMEALVALGRLGEAQTVGTKIVELEPLITSPRLRLAEIYLQLKQPDKAEDSLREVLKIEPASDQATRLLFDLYISQKKLEAAGSLVAVYNERAPDQSWASIALAKLYLSFNLPEQAYDKIKKIRTSEETDPEVAVLKAITFYQQKKYKESAEILLGAEKRYPENPVISFNLALTLESAGANEEAEARYRKIVNHAEFGPKASVNLALLMEKTGKVNEAISILERAKVPTHLELSTSRKLNSLKRKLAGSLGGAPNDR